MRIIFLVVGRMKSGPERELVDEYIKRAGPIARSLGFRGIEEVEVASGAGSTQRPSGSWRNCPLAPNAFDWTSSDELTAPVISPPILQNGATRVSLT